MKKCKVCKQKFEAKYSTLQATCAEPSCMIAYSQQQKAKQVKRDIAKRKEKLKTLADYKRELRAVLHKYVRLRDIKRGCISCGRELIGKYDAGHFLSAGAFPNLAFNPLNIHGQCVRCNQHLHGNLIAYSERLPHRIGQHNYELLLSLRNSRTSMTIDEAKALILKYKSLILKLTQQNND